MYRNLQGAVKMTFFRVWFTVTVSKCCVPISPHKGFSRRWYCLCKKAFKKILIAYFLFLLSLYNIHTLLAFGTGQFPPLLSDAQKNTQFLQILCHLVAG